MRLCGISSRFQLLSPCIRQVTHALLTRPPLSHLRWINSQQAGSIFGRGASFDLHVLSTPPAFILSQDQTLVKSVCSVRMTLAIHPLLFVLEIVNDYSFNNVRSENLFWIFRDGCCSIINVLVCCFFNSHINLTYLFMFVNNFFNFFKKSLWSSFKRRRRDLNPRAAINDLLPFQGSPFSHLGTSPSSCIRMSS